MNDHRSNQIERLARERKLGDALALATEWAGQEPDKSDAWFALAYVHQLMGELAAAHTAVTRALQCRPDDASLLFERGVIEFRLTEYARAAETFNDCANVCRESGDAYYLDAARIAGGRCHLDAGNVHDAAAAIEGLADDAATWLAGRETAGQLSSEIEARLIRKHAVRAGL